MINIYDIQNKSRDLYPALLLERKLPRKSRRRLRKFAFIGTIVGLLILILGSAGVLDLGQDIFRVRAGAVLLLIIWIKFHLLEAFYLSHYFYRSKVDFEVAQFAYRCCDDATKEFVQSEIGTYLMRRLNVNDYKIKNFLENPNRQKIAERDLRFPVTQSERMTILLFAHTIYKTDLSFGKFLHNNSISERMFLEALNWVDEVMYKSRDRGLIFKREHLEQVPSLGKNWTLNKFSILDKYADTIYQNRIYRSLADHWTIYSDEADQLQNALLQGEGQNVLLLTPYTEVGLEIISALGKMIIEGTAMYRIEDKDVWVLDFEKFVVANQDADDFEQNMKAIMADAANFLNVILVIPNLARLVEKSVEMGRDVSTILSDAILSKNVHVVGLASAEEYYASLQTNHHLMKSFSKMEVRQIDHGVGMRILQEEIYRQEKKYRVFYTYQALKAVEKKFNTEREVEAHTDHPYQYLKDTSRFLKKLSKYARRHKIKFITLKMIRELNF